MSEYVTTLIDFLNTPLHSGDALFERFASLPGAQVGKGADPLQRYVYIAGTRPDRVVLVAHVDTVWDTAYGKGFSEEREVLFEDGVFRSGNPRCGIGADDRAGCAMLWKLRDCGHSLLITDGEEHGKRGALYLRKTNRKLFRELNAHRYMIELDWAGTDGCLFNQVDNTRAFKAYIAKTLGFTDSAVGGGTDLQMLCRRVCGVNVGIGYHNYHTRKECLVLSEWENTYHRLEAFLKQPQPRFHSDRMAPVIRFFKRCVSKGVRILKGQVKKT